MKVIEKDVNYVTINFAENGYIVEYSGQTDAGDYHTTKRLCSSFEEMVEQLQTAVAASEYKD